METLPITSFEEFKLTFGRAASREGIIHVEGMLRAMGRGGMPSPSSIALRITSTLVRSPFRQALS